uniref:NADH dehydrogenase subunit 2 n=1 Tax=Physaloptera rara TaxID=2358290 RepID=A0A4Y6I4P7_9BILA|nr:NADH dehydrogenase subunit 2 [Physaloptera rara]
MFFMVLISWLCFLVSDYVIWWSVFVVSTVIFVFLMSGAMAGSSLIQYYLIQEVCGYFFLILGGSLSLFVLMMKSGSAPLHFWIFSIVSFLRGSSLVWFLTVQKLPYFFVMLVFLGGVFFYFLFSGMLVCYLQFFFLRFWNNMVLVASTESFNWLLMLGCLVSSGVFFLSLVYYFVMLFIIGFSYGGDSFMNWEMLLIFFNTPFCVTFLLKVMVLVFFVQFNFFVLLLLLFMPLISLGIVFWFMYNMFVGVNLGAKSVLGFFLFPLMVLVFF